MSHPPAETVLRLRNLHKTFRTGFLRRRFEAVCGVDLDLRRGETLGLVGPNGAGKTTTITMILGLVFPTQGSIELFGASADRRQALARIGYLPENPYVYRYLRPLEFLDFCGRLMGMPTAERRQRCVAMVQKVGLEQAVDRPLGKFSKGMLQRMGLAQALLHDPELLILDEPMSGLDPIGRRQVRELLADLRLQGKTLLFTSHILSDVETLCDRVVVLQRGRVTAAGKLDELRHEGETLDKLFEPA